MSPAVSTPRTAAKPVSCASGPRRARLSGCRGSTTASFGCTDSPMDAQSALQRTPFTTLPVPLSALCTPSATPPSSSTGVSCKPSGDSSRRSIAAVLKGALFDSASKRNAAGQAPECMHNDGSSSGSATPFGIATPTAVCSPRVGSATRRPLPRSLTRAGSVGDVLASLPPSGSTGGCGHGAGAAAPNGGYVSSGSACPGATWALPQGSAVEMQVLTPQKPTPLTAVATGASASATATASASAVGSHGAARDPVSTTRPRTLSVSHSRTSATQAQTLSTGPSVSSLTPKTLVF